jgi:ATP-dependent RNA helicase MRH4
MDISSDSELSELASPSPPPARFARAVTPINMDEINAPPASSDSEADDDVWPDIRTLAKKRRRPSITTPLRKTNDNEDVLSDVSSPPSLTHSPNLTTRGRGAKKRQHPTHPTTADLASLLPKRRYRRRQEEFDIDTDQEDDDDDDDDDDDVEQQGRSKRRRASRPPSRAASRQRPNVLKTKQMSGSVRRSARTASKTHRREEDKENESEDEQEQENSQFQPLPDDTFDAGTNIAADVQNADELKTASRKFKEVDKWELSFEEVAEPPSPQGAR